MASSTPPAPPHPPASSSSTKNIVPSSTAKTVHPQQRDQSRQTSSQAHTPGNLQQSVNDSTVIEKAPGQGTRNAPFIITDSGDETHRRPAISKNLSKVNPVTPVGQGLSSILQTPRSRRLQRAATMAESPSIGRGFRGRSGSFGAGLMNVPTPIVTQRQIPAQQLATRGDNSMQFAPLQHANGSSVSQMAPPNQLPMGNAGGLQQATGFGLNQMAAPNQLPMGNAGAIGNAYPNMYHQQQVLRSANGVQITGPQQQLPGSTNGVQTNGAHAPQYIDFYALRADEIGPRHGFPGVGSLQDLLTPPGWRPGDPPINEEQANAIFSQRRRQAQISLDATVHEFDHLPAEERQNRINAKNDAWDASRNMEDALRIERIKVYRTYQATLQQSAPARSRNEIPTALARPATPSSHGTPPLPGGNLQPVVNQIGLPVSSVSASLPLSGGHLYSRLRSAQLGIHYPHMPPLSPSMVDPSLIQQTCASVVSFYRANHALLTQLNEENEQYLKLWGNVIHRSYPQYFRDATPAMQGGSSGAASEPRGVISHDHAASSFNAPHGPSNLSHVGNVVPQNQVATAARARPAGTYQGNIQYPVSYIRSTAPHVVANEVSNSHRLPTNPAREPVKRTSPTSTTESGSWRERYREEINKANLPPPALDGGVLRAAGLPVNTHSTDAKPSPVAGVKTKAARGKPAVDPAGGYVISSRSARALIAQGATNARDQPMGISQSTQTDAHGLSATGKLSHSPLRREEGAQSLANKNENSMKATVRDADEESGDEVSSNATESDGATHNQHAGGQSSSTQKPQRQQKQSKRAAAGSHGLAKKRSKLDVEHSDD